MTGIDSFRAAVPVSDDTAAKLATYAGLIEKWTRSINLVARGSVGDLWTRHFIDSAQVYQIWDKRGTSWADLGCGGGFPGMVVAILARGEGRQLAMHLVESDQRKAAFLRAVSRETSTPVTIHAARIEDVPPLAAEIVSARALAPLTDLLGYALRHRAPNGQCLFLKGERYGDEIADALAKWRFQSQNFDSRTQPGAAILNIGEFARVPDV